MESTFHEQVSRTEKEILSENLCFGFWDANILTTKSKFKNLSTEISYAVIVLAIFTCVLGLFTNSIVIYLTTSKMKEQKSRLWFLNLAVADSLFLLTTPLRLIVSLAKHWTLGSLLCKLNHYANVCNLYSSSFLIAALSIDRVLSVAKPLWHRRFFTQHICFCICTIIWLVVLPLGASAIYYNDVNTRGNSTACAFFPFLYDTSKNDSRQSGEKILYISLALKALAITGQINDTWQPDGFVRFPEHRHECKGSMCCADDNSVTLYKQGLEFTYVTFVPRIIIGYFIPLCVMIFSNLIIVLQVRQSCAVNSKKLYKFIAILIGVFVLTKTPAAISNIIALKATSTLNISLMIYMNSIGIIVFVIGNVSSCLNPVLYVLVGSRARSLLSSSLLSKWTALSSFTRSNKSVKIACA